MTTSTMTRRGDELRTGNVLVRDGQRLRCGTIERSATHPGSLCIDVGFGVLQVPDSYPFEVELLSDTSGSRLRPLQEAHADALTTAEGDSNDEEIEAWRELAEEALGLVPGYEDPVVVHLGD